MPKTLKPQPLLDASQKLDALHLLRQLNLDIFEARTKQVDAYNAPPSEAAVYAFVASTEKTITKVNALFAEPLA